MDAKGLVSEAVAIRCSPPPARRRVPIQFDAWIVMSLSWYQFLLQCWDVALNLNENKCQKSTSQWLSCVPICKGLTNTWRRTPSEDANCCLTGWVTIAKHYQHPSTATKLVGDYATVHPAHGAEFPAQGHSSGCPLANGSQLHRAQCWERRYTTCIGRNEDS